MVDQSLNNHDYHNGISLVTALSSCNQLFCYLTRPDGRVSKASISHFGRSEDPVPTGLNQSSDFKIDTCHFLANCCALLG